MIAWKKNVLFTKNNKKAIGCLGLYNGLHKNK